MDRRYQVFVSSTYEDLREERMAVINALLQLDSFPAGMELFPASDEDSWTLIKSVIDDSDYYVIVLGGRYGSIKPGSTKSFTQLEYEYATSVGKPTIAFIHSHPGDLPADKTEKSDEGHKRLDQFRAELKQKHCRYWRNTGELQKEVLVGILNLKKTRPGEGWVRGSEVDDAALKDEVIMLRRQVETLNLDLERAKSEGPPEGTEDLAQGSLRAELLADVCVWGDFDTQIPCYVWITWNAIIRALLPQTFGAGADERQLTKTLMSLIREEHETSQATYKLDWSTATLAHSSFGKVMNQMVALGLVSAVPAGDLGRTTVWMATRHGAVVGSRKIAIKGNESPF